MATAAEAARGLRFDASPEHELLRETVREFFRRELPPERVAELDQAREPLPRDLWRRMGELGWAGLPVPRRYGGAEGDALAAVVLVEELARHWASSTFDYVIASMLARVLLAHGSEEQRERLLPPLARGEIAVAFSLTEPSGGTDLFSLTTRAGLRGGEWIVRGQKLYTSNAPTADVVCVLARTDEPTDGKRSRGLSLILVEPQEAVHVRKLKLLGMRSGGTSEVWYDDARAPESALLGERGRGFYHLIGSLNDERVTTAAIGVGIAAAAFEEALRYAKEREAFGRPIGQFQALQHYLADMATEIEMVRLLTQKAAWLLDEGKPCSLEAAMANVAAGEAAVRVTDKGMRILAGHGMTEDSPMERYLRDARLQVFSPISNEMGRNTIGELLGLPAELLMAAPLLVDVTDGVAVLTLNRPERLNAVNSAVLDGLEAAFDRIDRDRAIRVAVLAGAGTRAFTAGIDLDGLDSPEDFARFVWRELTVLYDRVVRLRVPIIAAVEGVAYATGCEVPLCCDIVYAGAGARFCFVDVKLGIAVASSGWPAAQKLNRMRFAELLFTSAEFDAATAVEIGLATRAVPAGRALETALETARAIAAQAPLAVELSRRALVSGYGDQWSNFMELQRQAIFSEDFAEGLRAFREKRPPVFRGR